MFVAGNQYYNYQHESLVNKYQIWKLPQSKKTIPGESITMKIFKCNKRIWVKKDCLLSFNITRTTRKTKPPMILRCHRNIFFWVFYLLVTRWYIDQQPYMSNNLLLQCIFAAMGTCLPGHCLVMMGGILTYLLRGLSPQANYRIHFTEPQPNNKTHILMGDIYEVCHWNGLRCHDTHTKFHKDWF
jgi:hypothetical protein